MCKDNGTPATNNSASITAPWSGAVPYLSQGLSGAQNLYQSGGPQYYPGQTYAGANPSYNQAITNLSNVGNAAATSTPQNNPANSFFSGAMQGNGPGLDTLRGYANGDYLRAGNPYFSQMADTVRANVLPGINAQFAGAGRGTSGLAARAAGQGLGDAIGGLAYNNYQQGLGQQQNAANSLATFGQQSAGASSNIYNQTLQNQLAGGNAQMLAGQTQQGLEQGYLTDAQNRWNYNQNMPMKNLQDYIRNITGQVAGTGQTTSTGTAQPAQPGFWNQLGATALGVGSFFT